MAQGLLKAPGPTTAQELLDLRSTSPTTRARARFYQCSDLRQKACQLEGARRETTARKAHVRQQRSYAKSYRGQTVPVHDWDDLAPAERDAWIAAAAHRLVTTFPYGRRPTFKMYSRLRDKHKSVGPDKLHFGYFVTFYWMQEHFPERRREHHPRNVKKILEGDRRHYDVFLLGGYANRYHEPHAGTPETPQWSMSPIELDRYQLPDAAMFVLRPGFSKAVSRGTAQLKFARRQVEVMYYGVEHSGKITIEGVEGNACGKQLSLL